jgi:hypothetical protein
MGVFACICDERPSPAWHQSQKYCLYRFTIKPSQQQVVTEMVMNKLIIALMAIYFLGDPGLQYIAWLGELKIYVAAAITLVSMPWVASQLDG